MRSLVLWRVGVRSKVGERGSATLAGRAWRETGRSRRVSTGEERSLVLRLVSPPAGQGGGGGVGRWEMWEVEACEAFSLGPKVSG